MSDTEARTVCRHCGERISALEYLGHRYWMHHPNPKHTSLSPYRNCTQTVATP